MLQVDKKKVKRKLLLEISEWLQAMATSVAVIALVMVFFRPTTVVNRSMVPNFQEGDRLVVASFLPLERQDVVIFRSKLTLSGSRWQQLDPIHRLFYSPGDTMTLIKRIIGLPGDHLVIRDGKVYINGEELIEEYILGDTLDNMELIVPEGHYMLMGDNRENSLDSRHSEVGMVAKKDIVGRVILCYWPIEQIKFIGG